MDGIAGLTGLARLSRLLVHEQDPVGVITVGLLEACSSVSADAGGVLVTSGNDHLDVLAATSHRAADVEAYQAMAEHGPCVESMREVKTVSVDTPADANARWPGFGDHMRAAGYERAYAVPMRWQGSSIGGLNLFFKHAATEPVDGVLLQTFADILTLAAVHVRPLSADDAIRRLQEALAARGGIEQAKGVLSWQRGLDMVDAYAALLSIADENDLTLGEAADVIVERAAGGETL
jgi:hypothetical protein